jgi:hypothetical protein
MFKAHIYRLVATTADGCTIELVNKPVSQRSGKTRIRQDIAAHDLTALTCGQPTYKSPWDHSTHPRCRVFIQKWGGHNAKKWHFDYEWPGVPKQRDPANMVIAMKAELIELSGPGTIILSS